MEGLGTWSTLLLLLLTTTSFIESLNQNKQALPVSDCHCKNDARFQRPKRQAKVTCPLLPSPSNGKAHIEAEVPGFNDVVKYTCNENYTMIGSSARNCLRSGDWAGEAPTCEKLCPFPIVDINVKATMNPDRVGAPILTTLGSEIIAELLFSCEVGFVLVGAPRIRCASGVWDQHVPKCVADPECSDPGDPQNGERFVVHGQVGAQYKMGTQLFFNCSDGHQLIGSSNITCMPFSRWSASIPLCIPNVISDCFYECKSASASVLNVLERPLICSLDDQDNARFILHPTNENTKKNK